MQRLITYGCAAFLVVATIGCGGSGGGLATDSGAMTIEEYEKQAAAAEQGMDAAPKDATQAPAADQ